MVVAAGIFAATRDRRAVGRGVAEPGRCVWDGGFVVQLGRRCAAGRAAPGHAATGSAVRASAAGVSAAGRTAARGRAVRLSRRNAAGMSAATTRNVAARGCAARRMRIAAAGSAAMAYAVMGRAVRREVRAAGTHVVYRAIIVARRRDCVVRMGKNAVLSDAVRLGPIAVPMI